MDLKGAFKSCAGRGFAKQTAVAALCLLDLTAFPYQSSCIFFSLFSGPNPQKVVVWVERLVIA